MKIDQYVLELAMGSLCFWDSWLWYSSFSLDMLLISYDIAFCSQEDNDNLFCHFLYNLYTIFSVFLFLKYGDIHGGSFSLKGTNLFGIKFIKTFIKVLLRILTCLWTFLLKNKKASQFDLVLWLLYFDLHGCSHRLNVVMGEDILSSNWF